MTDLITHYRAQLENGEISFDREQEKAAFALERLRGDLEKPKKTLLGKKKPVRGVYIHGGVGRGKSMLMDLFFTSVPRGLKKRRVHFHEFMIETHDWMHKRRAEAMDDLLPQYARYVAKSVDVLCFDEFHVTDVADAMILSRLFTDLFDMGLAIVATTNWPPDRLYEGGLQRERFMPFIALIKERMEIIHVDSETDYREVAVRDLETYLYPLTAETHRHADDFFKVLSDHAIEEKITLNVKGREFHARSAGRVARFTFSELCEQPHGAEDYLAIVDKFDAVIIENVPRMGYDRRNEAKRFMTLIDVLYDNRRRVIITAEAAAEKLYHGTDHAFEFDRTISRLQEMQSTSYLPAA
jgi:cell division protein ZapE